MKKSDIIMLCSTRNSKILEFQIQMLDSFVKNTPDECKLFIVENNSESRNYNKWQNYVLSKKQNFYFSKIEFNMNKLYNEATKLTNNEFIMYSNSDIIFYENWYYNLLNWFDEISNLFVISPFTKAYDWDLNATGVYRKNTDYIKEFQESIHLPGWFYCFKRESNYIWDEKFKAHFQDNDFVNTLKQMKDENSNLKSGFAYNSRVDHIGGMTYKNLEVDYFYNEGKQLMLKKWGENFI